MGYAERKEQSPQGNVPNLRFPEFSGEWIHCALGDISEVTKLAGFEYTQYVTYEDSGSIIALRGLNCKNGRLDLSDVKYIDNSNLSTLTRSKLYIGDILFTYVGTVGEVAIIEENDRYYLAPNVSRIRLNNGYNPYFVKQLLHTNRFYNKIIFPLIATSSQPALSMENVRKFALQIPSISEQQKISSFLALLDERIATQIKIIEDLKKLKSAISNEIFDHTSNRKCELKEIASVIMGQSPSSHAYNNNADGLPLIQGNLDIENGLLSPRIYTSEITQTCEYGDVILTVRAPVGEIAIAQQEACIGRGVCSIRPHVKNDTNLLFQFLQYFKPKWISLEQGSAFTAVSGTDIRGIAVSIPSADKIQLLDVYDNKIRVETRILTNLTQQKLYLLAQMFI